MAEYIEKQAAIESALAAVPRDEYYDRQIEVFINLIPPADVRPVVLCKDCAHWDCDTIEMHDRCNNAKEGVDKTQVRFAECLQFSSWAKCMMTREDDYCSAGRFTIRGIKDDANPCCGSYNGADMRGGDTE